MTDGTGAAGRGHCVIVGVGPGLGAALARTFASDGYDLTLLSRGRETSDALAQELAETTVRVDTVDLADADSIRDALSAAQDALGSVSVLIVNGARYSTGRARDVTETQLAGDFATNVIGASVACRAVLPSMIAAGTGTILLTGGGAALYPSAETPALSVTKAGLRAYAYSLHDDMRGTGVHVTTVTIEGGIGSRPHFAAETIAAAYLDIHHQESSQWVAELEYVDPD